MDGDCFLLLEKGNKESKRKMREYLNSKIKKKFMKNSKILFASAIMFGMMVVDTNAQVLHKRFGSSLEGVKNSKVLMMQGINHRMQKYENSTFKEAEASVFKPQGEMVYTYAEDGTWELEGEYSYTYKNGKVYTQTQKSGDEVVATQTDYSDDGLTKTIIEKTSEDGGRSFINLSKAVFVYDPVVTDLVVSKKKYEWSEDENEWKEISDSYVREITRDGDDNITSLVVKVPYMGNYDATERYTNTVDPVTKHIDTYKYECLNYDESGQLAWITEQYLTGIKWAKTNGQLVSQYDEWMLWGNELSEATLAYEEGGETKSFGNIKIDYTGDGGYSEVFNYTDKLGRTDTKKEMLDKNGSFSIEEKTIEDLDKNGKLTDSEVSGWMKEIVTYDDHKNIVEDVVYELDEEGTGLVKTMGEKNDLTYDENYSGAVKETITSSYDMDAQDYVPYSKVVVTGFTNVTSGIGSVNASDSPTAVYNLQGIRIDKSAVNGRGIFIVKKNRKTMKVVR